MNESIVMLAPLAAPKKRRPKKRKPRFTLTPEQRAAWDARRAARKQRDDARAAAKKRRKRKKIRARKRAKLQRARHMAERATARLLLAAQRGEMLRARRQRFALARTGRAPRRRVVSRVRRALSRGPDGDDPAPISRRTQNGGASW